MVSTEPIPARAEERTSLVAPPAPTRTLPANGWPLRIAHREDLLDHAIQDLERQARVSFFVSVTIDVTLASLMLLASLFFIGSLILRADWESIASSGAAAAIAFLSLLLVQLSPLGRRQNRQAVLLAQAEAARRSLVHSLDLWDGYLEPRLGKLKPEEMALAVESLAKSSEMIIANLANVTTIRAPSGNAPPQSRKDGPADPAVAAKY